MSAYASPTLSFSDVLNNPYTVSGLRAARATAPQQVGYAQALTGTNSPTYSVPRAPAPQDSSYGSGTYTLPGGGVFHIPGDNMFAGNPDVQHSYYTDNPDAAFGAWLSQRANPMDLFGQYIQRNYGQLLDQYKSNLTQNPYASFYDYLNANQTALQHQFNNLAPIDRGESATRMTGRVKSFL